MAEYHDTFLDGNELIEAAIDRYYRESSKETLIAILDTIRQRMHADGHFICPIILDEEDENRFAFGQKMERYGTSPLLLMRNTKRASQAA